MRTRFGVFPGLLLLLFCNLPRALSAMTPDTPDLPEAGKSVPGSLVPPAEELGVRVLSHHGEWSSFFSMNGGSEEIFLITGRLENTSGKPLTAITMAFSTGAVSARTARSNRLCPIGLRALAAKIANGAARRKATKMGSR